MKHIKRILLFLLFCIFCLTKCATFVAKAQDEQSLLKEVKEAQDGRGLSLEQCIRFAIGNSFSPGDSVFADIDAVIGHCAVYASVLTGQILKSSNHI